MESFKKYLNKKTLSVDQIAKKHKVPAVKVKQQLKQGINTEMKHTNKKGVAKEIALDHLGERPDYYKKLKKVEDN